MIVKILGIFDLLAAVFFWVFAFYGIIPGSIVLFFAVYLIIKGTIFVITMEAIASGLDIISGLVLFFSLQFALPNFIIVIVTLYLIQKGVFSLL